MMLKNRDSDPNGFWIFTTKSTAPDFTVPVVADNELPEPLTNGRLDGEH